MKPIDLDILFFVFEKLFYIYIICFLTFIRLFFNVYTVIARGAGRGGGGGHTTCSNKH